jgi:hypothetical protein
MKTALERKHTRHKQVESKKKSCSLPMYPGSNLTVHACHPAVPYMLIGFAGCSVGRGICRGARKLARKPT